jgi:hypothetical protein
LYTVKARGCNSAKPPLLLDDCMDAGGRATHGAVAERIGERRIKSTGYILPHPSPFDPAQDRLLPQGKRSTHLCRYSCLPLREMM